MTKKEEEFIKTVWTYYKRHGRHSLPWRRTRDSYKILVSEVMLQQTQVERVIPKYKSFLKRFSTLQKLGGASLGDVLREWQGLGYNRRAKALHECAKEIIQNRRGRTPTVPETYEQLVQLSGIGPYTAGAIMAFAYNTGIPIVETNIRTACVYHFFSERRDVSDLEILRLTAVFLKERKQKRNTREWYYALMDYGAYLKKTVGNYNERSRHYTKQSVFKDSDRQIRGAILRMLSIGEESRPRLHKKLDFDPKRIDAQLERLLYEGLVMQRNSHYSLPFK